MRFVQDLNTHKLLSKKNYTYKDNNYCNIISKKSKIYNIPTVFISPLLYKFVIFETIYINNFHIDILLKVYVK